MPTAREERGEREREDGGWKLSSVVTNCHVPPLQWSRRWFLLRQWSGLSWWQAALMSPSRSHHYEFCQNWAMACYNWTSKGIWSRLRQGLHTAKLRESDFSTHACTHTHGRTHTWSLCDDLQYLAGMTWSRRKGKCVRVIYGLKAGVKNEGCQDEKLNYSLLP